MVPSQPKGQISPPPLVRTIFQTDMVTSHTTMQDNNRNIIIKHLTDEFGTEDA
jgi:hypothetical protein